MTSQERQQAISEIESVMDILAIRYVAFLGLKPLQTEDSGMSLQASLKAELAHTLAKWAVNVKVAK